MADPRPSLEEIRQRANELIPTTETRWRLIEQVGGRVSQTERALVQLLRDLLAMLPQGQDGCQCQHTVQFSLRDPDWVCHLRREDCPREEPHPVSACGAFIPAVLPKEPAPPFVECACGGANDHCEGKCG
jgi:hypothetical protein